MNYLLRRRGLGRTSARTISELSKTGIQVFRNDKRLPEADIVFRWGCTSNVQAKTIVNQAKAIHLASDKTAYRRLLQPKELCPATWFSPNEAGIQYPVVVRPQHHHQGRNLFVCNDRAELDRAWARCGPGGYISELINKVAEYRVFVVSGRVACVASKTPGNPNDVAWNVFQGGKFDNVNWGAWPLRVVRVAVEGFALSGLDFGGVDIMVDAEGEAYILEVNSAPSLTSPYRQSCMAKAFDYIVQNGKALIPLVDEKGGYRKFIHPAVDPTALLRP